MKIASSWTVVCLLIISCGKQEAVEPLSADPHIENAWVRMAPPTAHMLAAYMDVTNPGPDDVLIVGADCSGFRKTEIHRTEIVNDVATMSRQESVTITTGESVSFTPGGLHLMLHNPFTPLKPGMEIECTLVLHSGSRLSTMVPVRKPRSDHG